jgi:hypothetical protein
MHNLSIEQLMEMFKVLHPNQSTKDRQILAKEVYKDLRRPKLTIDYKNKQFTIVQVTKEITIIDGVKFTPMAMDIFDCCLGYLVNHKNRENYKKHLVIDFSSIDEQYKLMYQWLEEKNPQYINVLNKQYKNA